MNGIRGAAYVAGVFEHPERDLPDHGVPQIHAEVALGALADAGLESGDVDAYFCAGDAPGWPVSMADYLGLSVSYFDSTEAGGASPLTHLGHAAAAIAAGKVDVALVTQGGNPRATARRRGVQTVDTSTPEHSFENLVGATIVARYALAAQRHMFEHGTTAAQLAAVKVTASEHAQHNPRAFLRRPVGIDDVLDSPMISSPLHRLDCCVVTDGGGAAVLVSEAVARKLDRTCIALLGHGEAFRHSDGGRIDLGTTGAGRSGAAAFTEARVGVADVDYASIYDSFTIAVIMALEELGFAGPGQGGAFAASGALRAPDGALPWNTDGGGLCNNHPANRGGMVKLAEAVRQLRGEANPEVQVPNCEIALVHALGGAIGTRVTSTTLLLGR